MSDVRTPDEISLRSVWQNRSSGKVVHVTGIGKLSDSVRVEYLSGKTRWMYRSDLLRFFRSERDCLENNP